MTAYGRSQGKSIFEKIMEAEKLKSTNSLTKHNSAVTVEEKQDPDQTLTQKEERNTAPRPSMPKDQQDPPPSIDESVFLIPIHNECPLALVRKGSSSVFSPDVHPSGNRAVSPIILYTLLRDPEDSLDGSFGGSVSILEPDGLSPGGARHGGIKHTDGDEEPVPIDLTSFQGHTSDCCDSTEERSYNERLSDGPESDGIQNYTHSLSVVSSEQGSCRQPPLGHSSRQSSYRVPVLGVITNEHPSSWQSSSKTQLGEKNEIWRGGQGLDLIHHTGYIFAECVHTHTTYS